MNLPIVVYSHLRWDSVFQRPHHIVSRLARERTVVFVEEPLPSEPGDPDSWELQWPDENLVVARPRLPADAPGFQAGGARLVAMTRALLRSLAIEHHAAWLYTPMALHVALAMKPSRVAYDCMDDLASFLGAPREMVLREAQLLRVGDVVFTGGPSLYRAKRALHPNVHCFPSSVDAPHFRRAREPGPDPDEVRGLARPRLGFYGVLDERLDAKLVADVADARPGWQIVLVGPVAKIDPACLPRRPNVHYLGQRPYEELPAHLAAWDVCLLPFARNDATRLISPTKTLEYMAAEKPIASTPIRDVADPYGHVVYLGHDAPSFVEACERALAEDAETRARRVGAMRRIVARTSWDVTARAMLAALESADAKRRAPPAAGDVARVRPLTVHALASHEEGAR